MWSGRTPSESVRFAGVQERVPSASVRGLKEEIPPVATTNPERDGW